MLTAGTTATILTLKSLTGLEFEAIESEPGCRVFRHQSEAGDIWVAPGRRWWMWLDDDVCVKASRLERLVAEVRVARAKVLEVELRPLGLEVLDQSAIVDPLHHEGHAPVFGTEPEWRLMQSALHYYLHRKERVEAEETYMAAMLTERIDEARRLTR